MRCHLLSAGNLEEILEESLLVALLVISDSLPCATKNVNLDITLYLEFATKIVTLDMIIILSPAIKIFLNGISNPLIFLML